MTLSPSPSHALAQPADQAHEQPPPSCGLAPCANAHIRHPLLEPRSHFTVYISQKGLARGVWRVTECESNSRISGVACLTLGLRERVVVVSALMQLMGWLIRIIVLPMLMTSFGRISGKRVKLMVL